MTKREFISSLAREKGLILEDATKIVETVFEHMKFCLLQGSEVRIDGVGYFVFFRRSSKTVKSALAKKEYKIPPKTQLKFRVLPAMAEEVDLMLGDDKQP